MVLDHGHEMPGDPPRPECQEGQEGQGQVMPAEFVEILEKGTKHLPAFLCLWGGLCGDVFPRAFEGFWDFLRRFPNPSKIYPIGSMYAIHGNLYHQYTPNVSIYTIHGSYGYGIVKNEDDYWYHVRFLAAILIPWKILDDPRYLRYPRWP